VIANPVPLTASEFHSARTAFMASLPAEIGTAIGEVLAGAADIGVVWPQVLEHYVAKPETARRIDIAPNLVTYGSVLASLGDFDFTVDLDYLSRFSCIIGERDITPRSSLGPILDSCRSLDVLPNVGHFPWHEAPDRVLPLLRRRLEQPTFDQELIIDG
jgi:hypothetical protein